MKVDFIFFFIIGIVSFRNAEQASAQYIQGEPFNTSERSSRQIDDVTARYIESEQVDTTELIAHAKHLAVAVCPILGLQSTAFCSELPKVNAKIVQSYGYRGIIFIKVELRDEYLIKNFLFRRTLTDEDKDSLDLYPVEDDSYFKALKKINLKKYYNITDSTSYSEVDNKLDSVPKNWERNVYVAYFKVPCIYCLVNSSRCDRDERFQNELLSGRYFDDNIYISKKSKKLLRKKKMPDDVLSQLKIDY